MSHAGIVLILLAHARRATGRANYAGPGSVILDVAAQFSTFLIGIASRFEAR